MIYMCVRARAYVREYTVFVCVCVWVCNRLRVRATVCVRVSHAGICVSIMHSAGMSISNMHICLYVHWHCVATIGLVLCAYVKLFINPLDARLIWRHFFNLPMSRVQRVKKPYTIYKATITVPIHESDFSSGNYSDDQWDNRTENLGYFSCAFSICSSQILQRFSQRFCGLLTNVLSWARVL